MNLSMIQSILGGMSLPAIRLLQTFTLLLFVLTLSSCQTPRFREFENVKVGMSKEQVLEAAGGPSARDRRAGMDRWTYNIYDHPEGKTVREVHFLNGVATYVGPKPVPIISAEQQDHLNEIKNREAEERERVDYSSVHKQYEIQRFEPVEGEDEGPVVLEQKSQGGTAR